MKIGDLWQEQGEASAVHDDFIVGEREDQLLAFAAALMTRRGKMRPREHPFVAVPRVNLKRAHRRC